VSDKSSPDRGPAADIPFGPLQGARATLLPQFQGLGRTRPLGPGEYVGLANRGWGSEMTYTLPYQGQWAVLPGLWLMNGVPTHVTEDQALELAQASGLNWQTFADEEAAKQFADQREAFWQTAPYGRSDLQPPLWSRPWPPRRR